jgi:hypothetical protein
MSCAFAIACMMTSCEPRREVEVLCQRCAVQRLTGCWPLVSHACAGERWVVPEARVCDPEPEALDPEAML